MQSLKRKPSLASLTSPLLCLQGFDQKRGGSWSGPAVFRAWRWVWLQWWWWWPACALSLFTWLWAMISLQHRYSSHISALHFLPDARKQLELTETCFHFCHNLQAFTIVAVFNSMTFALKVTPLAVRALSEGSVAVKRFQVKNTSTSTNKPKMTLLPLFSHPHVI